MAIPERKSWFYENENLSPPLVCPLPFPPEFEVEINESVALIARNGSPLWEGGPFPESPESPNGRQWSLVAGDERG